MHAEESPRGRLAGVAALTAALTFALYLPTARFGFLNYDDPDYVTHNSAVARGLDAEGVRWAFGFHAANWHPLTWLAHMLDVTLFGLAAGPMHLVNAGLHALDAALLLLAFAALTRRVWPSALVAALFAVHPLRVQCVAWIAERKELLASAFFFALLWCWARFARTRSRGAYAAALACLALGCMAKPMLVTAPFVLLLLDAWPLGRWAEHARAGTLLALWREKLPFLLIAACSALLTWLAQRAGGAVGELEALPIAARLGTAGAGVLEYLRATLWPAGLAAFYPHPLLIGRSVLVPGIAGAALALVASLVAWRVRATLAPLFTGWFWFLGMLVPVMGLVQVGDQAWADRYAYLPTIGLYVALVFGLADALRARPFALGALATLGAATVAALALVTLRTEPAWADSASLFERALAVTDDDNWVAHNNLGLAYLERREAAPARAHFEAALRANPRFDKARFNLGLALELGGDAAAAEEQYRAFLANHPASPEAEARLDALARARSDPARAVARVRKDVEQDLADGQPARARERLDALFARPPDSPAAWSGLADLYARLGAWPRALECYERSFASGAMLPEAALGAAWILATGPDESLLDGARAQELADFGAAHGAPGALVVQAAAHARRGDFDAAIALQQQALAGTQAPEQARTLAEHLELYRAHRPFTRPR